MESLLIDNNGVEISSDESLGRIVVANKDFVNSFGVIVRERPALIWDAIPSQFLTGYQNFLQAYSQQTREIKEQVQQLFHPPLDGDSSMVNTLRPVAQQLELSHREYDVGFIHKLLTILASNAHQYYGYRDESRGDLRQHESSLRAPGCGKLALYLFGSKVQHSCNPNATYTSKTPDGALEYKAVRTIKAGEQVSFSYIGDLFHTPTFMRREKLHCEKDFLCMCERCTGPDYCRVAKCPECGEFSPSQTTPFSSMWKCVNGCTPSLVNETLERNYNDHLTRMKSMMRAETPDQLIYDFIRGATMDLSPTHFVCIRGWLELATLYASKAAEKEQADQLSMFAPPSLLERTNGLSDLSIRELRRKAALSGLRAISLIECVAENCKGCKPGCCNHSPVYESSSRMFHVCIDLIDLDPSEYPHEAKTMIRRYVPLMKATFGNDDQDVRRIETEILSQDSNSETLRRCECCKASKENLLVCSRCYLVHYCSKECQVKHWKSGHKAQCIPSP